MVGTMNLETALAMPTSMEVVVSRAGLSPLSAPRVRIIGLTTMYVTVMKNSGVHMNQNLGSLSASPTEYGAFSSALGGILSAM